MNIELRSHTRELAVLVVCTGPDLPKAMNLIFAAWRDVGYWAKLQAGKPATKVGLPARAAGMDDEVVIGGRNLHWSYRFTNEEIPGPLPDPPSFPEDLASVRERVRKTIGKVSVPRAMTAHYPPSRA